MSSQHALYSAHGYTPDESVGFLMGSVMSAMRGAMDEELAKEGDVSSAQWVILMLISHGKFTTAADMAKRMRYDSGSMTRMLDRLEQKGLIRRARSTDDRRMIVLELTEQGHAMARPGASCNVLNHFLRGFSRTELEQFKNFLRRMIANASPAP